MPYNLGNAAGTNWIFYRMSEGDGDKLTACGSNYNMCEITDAPIRWKDDPHPMTLCPAELVPHANIKSDTTCCEEQYLYHNGYDCKVPPLVFLNPAGVFQLGKGTICVYLMLTKEFTLADTNAKVLFEYGNLRVKYHYIGGNFYIRTFDATDGAGTVLSTASFPLALGVWDSFCYAFAITSGTPDTIAVTVYDMLSTVTVVPPGSTSVSAGLVSSTGAYLKMTGIDSTSPIAIKNVLLFDDCVADESDLDKYYWDTNL